MRGVVVLLAIALLSLVGCTESPDDAGLPTRAPAAETGAASTDAGRAATATATATPTPSPCTDRCAGDTGLRLRRPLRQRLSQRRPRWLRSS